jgi:DNA ligase-1
MRIREILMSIKETAGTLDKKQILKDNMNDVLQMIFEDTYSDNKYHVKKYNIWEAGDLTLDANYDTFHSMLKLLSERTVTGKAAIELVENTIGMYVFEDQWVLNCVMEKNLKVGISKDNFNDVMGNAIENFEVALAYNLEKVKGVDVLDGTYLASRKCDGARCITFATWDADNKTYDIVFKSRQGKEFKTLDKLKPVISKALMEWQLNIVDDDALENIVIDGEMCIVDENGDEHFNWIMKEITRKNHTIENPHYKMFDILCPGIAPTNEWNKLGYTDRDFSEGVVFEERYGMLCDFEYFIEEKQYASVLEQELITSQEDFDRWSKKASDGEWEGFMLRKNTVYKSGRTKDLLKVKKFQDAEYIVKDVVTGKATYNEGGSKEYDVVSALVIEHKGNIVEVGSGLSKEQRISWYSNPQEIVGKTITVQYFEETTNKNNNMISLRFPVLKYVYEDGRNV